MPVCLRCERVQPTGELRRNGHGGHVCLEGTNPFSRCRQIQARLRAERRALARTTRRAERSAA